MSKTTINNTLIGSGANSFLGIGKNRVMNGDMMIDQRNVGTLLTLTGPSVGKFSCDRWSCFNNNTGTFTVQQVSTTPPTGFTNYMHFACTSADASAGEYRLDHYIEGYNVRDFMLGTANAVTFTMSFWVRSNQTGLWGGSFYNNASSRAYIFSYTINSANTWEYKTITVPGDVTGTWTTGNNIGLGIRFGLGLGSSLLSTPGSWVTWPPYKYGPTGMNNFMSSTSNTFDLTGVQLEIGSSATAFEYVPWEIQLARCKRYYEKSYAYSTVPGSAVNLFNSSHQTVGTPSPSPNVYCPRIVFTAEKYAQPTMQFYTETGTLGSWTWNTSAGSGTPLVTTSAPSPTGFSPFQGADGTRLMGYGCWTADTSF